MVPFEVILTVNPLLVIVLEDMATHPLLFVTVTVYVPGVLT